MPNYVSGLARLIVVLVWSNGWKCLACVLGHMRTLRLLLESGQGMPRLYWGEGEGGIHGTRLPPIEEGIPQPALWELKSTQIEKGRP